MAGFAFARGKCVVAMSADGQDPPGLINDMLREFDDNGYEIVICRRQGRDESIYRIITSKLFYAVMRWLTFPDMPPGGFDFVLLGRRALNVLLENRDSHPFFQGQILWTGYRTKFISYERRKRQVGKSRWTFGKKLTYLIDGVLSYSYFPIRFISCTGILCALLGFMYAAIVVLSKVFLGNPVKGWTPLMVVVLVVGGLQMVMLGIIGEYLWRTVSQVRNRRPYIIDAVYEDAPPDERANVAYTDRIEESHKRVDELC
jgi:dolichol-phosphate mannosyltransferase